MGRFLQKKKKTLALHSFSFLSCEHRHRRRLCLSPPHPNGLFASFPSTFPGVDSPCCSSGVAGSCFSNGALELRSGRAKELELVSVMGVGGAVAPPLRVRVWVVFSSSFPFRLFFVLSCFPPFSFFSISLCCVSCCFPGFSFFRAFLFSPVFFPFSLFCLFRFSGWCCRHRSRVVPMLVSGLSGGSCRVGDLGLSPGCCRVGCLLWVLFCGSLPSPFR